MSTRAEKNAPVRIGRKRRYAYVAANKKKIIILSRWPLDIVSKIQRGFSAKKAIKKRDLESASRIRTPR